MNIAHLLRRSALLHAHRPALLHGDQVLWSYGTLAARTGSPVGIGTHIGRVDGNFDGIVDFREDEHRGEAGVAAALESNGDLRTRRWMPVSVRSVP